MNEIKHVAIIMDGNGRWANRRAHRRIWGHIRGGHVVSSIVEKASDLKLKALTLYAFSTENWNRPKDEIQTLFRLLKKFLVKERNRIINNNVKFKVIGDVSGIDSATRQLIFDLTGETKKNDGLKLNFAFGYGGKAELTDVVNGLIEANPGKKLKACDIENNLYTAESGLVDLLIRTGGDLRISNFLLWQLAYAELYFTDLAWPEFSAQEFANIIELVNRRERRFGQANERPRLRPVELNNLNRGDHLGYEKTV